MKLSLFEELKRRNVFKVGVTYLVLTWVVIQVTASAVPALNLPDWVNSLVFFLALIGFPFALFFAWAFEITPEGVKREQEVEEEDSTTSKTGNHLNLVFFALLAAGLGYFIWESRFQSNEIEEIVADELIESKTTDSTSQAPPNPSTEAKTSFMTKKTVAVLPFSSFSSDKEQGWFADGLTEEILNALARTRDLLVSSRTSSFSYKQTDKDIRTIASELGVEHVLEGSVRRGGDKIRVTAQLIRAVDGFHLWSQTYDRDYSDIIQIQEDIAISIAKSLGTAMDPKALAKMMDAGTNSVEAYENYLRAIAAVDDVINLEKIVPALEKSIELDPQFSKAIGQLGQYWFGTLDVVSQGANESLPTAERLALGNQYIDRAISILAEDPQAQFYNGLKAQYDLRFRDAEANYEALLARVPNHREAHEQLVDLKVKLGDREGARNLLGQAKDLFTKDRQYYINGIINHVWIMDTVAAAEMADEGLSKFMRDSAIAYQAQRAYLMAGELDKAKSMMQIVVGAEYPEISKYMVQIRQACAEGDIEQADQLYALTMNLSAKVRASTLWLFAQTMGKTTVAHDLIKHLDQPDRLIELSSHLLYYHFELGQYPNLKRVLEIQGINRNESQPVVFGCGQWDKKDLVDAS